MSVWGEEDQLARQEGTPFQIPLVLAVCLIGC